MAKVQALESQSFERSNPKTGLVEQIPALDNAWLEEVNFLPYLPPNSKSNRVAEKGEESSKGSEAAMKVDPLWMEALEMIDGDLHWLLQQTHHKFWCQVMYDASLHKFLDSYLRSAPRSYDSLTVASLPLKARELMRNIHKRVFMTFLRMATNKESTDHYLSPEVHGGIVYDHYLFDVPKILDLCVLYGEGNRPLLSKMITNLFESQPKYVEDWCSTIKSLLLIFDKVSEKVLNQKPGEAMRLDEAKPMTSSDLQDVVLYLSDVAVTLKCFVEVYPRCTVQLASAGWVERVVSFYGAVIPALQEHWHRLKGEIENSQYVKSRFRSLKCDLTWLVDASLHHVFISKVGKGQPKPAPGTRKGEGPGEEEGNCCEVDAFITTITAILPEKVFLREFEKHFSLKDTVREIQQAHPEIPETNFDYILSALGFSSPPAACRPSAAASSSFSDGARAAAVDEGVMMSLISQVKEVLSHLGDGFIRACLMSYSHNPEAVINHVLQDDLLPRLKELDQSLTSLPPNWQTWSSINDNTSTNQSRGREKEGVSLDQIGAGGGGGGDGFHGDSLLDQRSSVFDNDEFDVFRRKDVDRSRVHIGKKYDHTTVSSLLDDKSHLSSTRDKYKSYEVETPWVGYVSEERALQLEMEGGVIAGMGMGIEMYDPYNDEYDDTYDSQNVGAADNDSADELFTVKRLNEKGLYRRNWTKRSDEDEDLDEDKQTNISPVPPPTGGSQGPSHHNQPIPGNFSLLKRDKSESANPSDSIPKAKSSHKPTDTDKQKELESFGGGKGKRSQKGRVKDQRYHPSLGGPEGDKRLEENEAKRGGTEGGGKGEEGVAKGVVGGAKSGGGGAKGEVGGAKGGARGGGAKGGGGGEQRSRQSKERHKGSRANHNRRAMADRKRDRGMAGPPARY